MPHTPDCKRLVLEDIARSDVTYVVTWSGGSRGATAGFTGGAFSGLRQLRRLDSEAVRVLIDAKGSDCDLIPAPLRSWGEHTGRVHCVEGPNRGAREAHTVLRFCHDFYSHLPRRAVVFLQDDPEMKLMRAAGVGTDRFLNQLEQTYAARAGVRVGAADAGSTDSRPDVSANSPRPWELSPCPCTIDHEGPVTEARYGHYRTVTWWARTFLAPFARNGTAPPVRPQVPRRLAWPRHAQFAVPRAAILGRSRAWLGLQLGLTSLPSPHKSRSPRRSAEASRECTLRRVRKGVETCVMTRRERQTKWANFGAYVVDLGPLPTGPHADRRVALHGMSCVPRL